MGWSMLGGFLHLMKSIGCERSCSAQLPNAAPAVAAFPFRNEFEDFVNGFVFLVRPELNPCDQ